MREEYAEQPRRYSSSQHSSLFIVLLLPARKAQWHIVGKNGKVYALTNILAPE